MFGDCGNFDLLLGRFLCDLRRPSQEGTRAEVFDRLKEKGQGVKST
jgi:hypothetical protein